MFKLLITFCFTLVFLRAGALPALKDTPVHAQLKIDSTRLITRPFNRAAIKAYHDNPTFNYYTHRSGITAWDRFWEWVWNIWTNFIMWLSHVFEKLFGHSSPAQSSFPIWKYIILALGVCLITYIVFKLLGINLLHLFKKESEKTTVNYTESIENINEISFDEAIEDALAIKNYRLAVRLLYLRCLKQLSDKNLINWRIEKTNTAYLNELTDAEQRKQFKLVTRQFEYVWYGNFPIDGKSFQNINEIFQEFKRRLS
jgi:hypothetical protein